MTYSNKDWEDLLSCLNNQEVRYLIIGGIAVSAHGYTRYTKDIDIWVEPTEENADKTIAAINSFFGSSIGLDKAKFTTPGMLTKLGKEPFRVDFITSLPELEFDEAYTDSLIAPFGSLTVRYISIRHLIKVKEIAARPQDLADVSILKKRIK